MKSSNCKNPDDLPAILNVDEVSDFIGIGKSQMYELVKRIDFPAFRIGKRVFIPRDKFLAWIETQTAEKEALFYTDPRHFV